MTMPGRNYTVSSGYRYGFNGKENSPEISSGAVSFESRIFDCRIGKFLSPDPREADYSWQSTYAYFLNSPISIIDFKGEGGKKDKKPDPKPGSKGKVNVSFYSASDVIGTCDAVGGDPDNNKKDDCLTNFKTSHSKIKDENFKSFAVEKLSDVRKHLKNLKKEGYEIVTVILNAHADLSGGFWLGGGQRISNLTSVLKGNLSDNSVVILNMCNIGAGKDPNSRESELTALSRSIGKVVYASMSFGTGRSDMFNTSFSWGKDNPMSTELSVEEYIPKGKHEGYPDNSILYQNCYLRISPQLNLNNNVSIVSNLVVSSNGYASYTSSESQIAKNKKLLEQAQKSGRATNNPIPVRTINPKTN